MPLAEAAVYTEPFFVTVERVELKNAAGEWVKVIDPDKRFDLMAEEPVVQFFNNGRIPAGVYSNVRVTTRIEEHPHPIIFSKTVDLEPPLAIRKGAFIRVRFYFDFSGGSRTLDAKTVSTVTVTVDDDERKSGGNEFSFVDHT